VYSVVLRCDDGAGCDANGFATGDLCRRGFGGVDAGVGDVWKGRVNQMAPVLTGDDEEAMHDGTGWEFHAAGVEAHV